MEKMCPRCKGVGYVVYEKHGEKCIVMCPECGGRKTYEDKKM